jgi:hypothetical protein
MYRLLASATVYRGPRIVRKSPGNRTHLPKPQVCPVEDSFADLFSLLRGKAVDVGDDSVDLLVGQLELRHLVVRARDTARQGLA